MFLQCYDILIQTYVVVPAFVGWAQSMPTLLIIELRLPYPTLHEEGSLHRAALLIDPLNSLTNVLLKANLQWVLRY